MFSTFWAKMRRPWKRMRFADALVEIGGLPEGILHDENALRSWLLERDIPAEDMSVGYMWDAALGRLVQPQLISPTFITRSIIPASCGGNTCAPVDQ